MENLQQPDEPKAQQTPLQPPPLPQTSTGQNPQVKKLINALVELKSRASLQLLGIQAAAIAVIGIVLALCYLIPLASMANESGSSSDYSDASFASQINSFKAFIALFGAMLGGGLKISGTGGGFGFSGEAHLALSLVSVTGILAICAANFVVVRKLKRSVRNGGWKSAALTSGLHALVLALVFLIISLFGKLSMEAMEFVSATVSPRYASVFFTIFLTIFLTQFLATAPLRYGPAAPLITGLREALFLLVTVVAVFAVVGIIVALINKDEDTPWSIYFFLIPLLGTLGSYLGALAFLGALAPNVSGVASSLAEFTGDSVPTTVFRIWDFADGKGAWLIVLTVVLVIVVAIRVGIHRTRTAGINWQRTWQLPVVSLVLWMLLAWLTSISLGGKISAGEMGEMSADISFGITWYSVIFLALGAAVVSILAELLPLQVYRFAPGLLTALGGKVATHRWVSGESQVPATPASAASADAQDPTVGTPTTAMPVTPPNEVATTSYAAVPAFAAPAPALEPASATSKKKAKIAGFGVLGIAVLVGLGIGAVAYLNSQRKPEAQVEQYLSLLAEGKAAKAGEMVDPGIDNASRALLTDEAMANTEQRLKVVDVKRDSKNDSSATVTATYSINGEQHEQQFSVDRGDKEFGLLDTWELNEPLLVPVKISTDQVSEVTVGKAKVQLNEGESFYDETPSTYTGDFYVYPGIYSVTAPSTDYQQTDVQELRANHPDDMEAAVTLTTTATDKLGKLVLDEVHKFSTACVTPPTNLDEGCPYELQAKDLESFSVKKQADDVMLDGMNSFESTDVTFKYKEADTEYIDYDEREIERSLKGEIDWSTGQPVVTVHGSSWW
ncbi:hypothetical protein [Glutamicibacter sp. JC586]|uniref:hypothetical protein n=1 Tax=Glutamicibacter sp. JC586 TaxID=2590552 RepID=UPI00135AD576|nr:hypothetical protein [Glutamicibacter sp. JC586]